MTAKQAAAVETLRSLPSRYSFAWDSPEWDPVQGCYYGWRVAWALHLPIQEAQDLVVVAREALGLSSPVRVGAPPLPLYYVYRGRLAVCSPETRRTRRWREVPPEVREAEAAAERERRRRYAESVREEATPRLTEANLAAEFKAAGLDPLTEFPVEFREHLLQKYDLSLDYLRRRVQEYRRKERVLRGEDGVFVRYAGKKQDALLPPKTLRLELELRGINLHSRIPRAVLEELGKQYRLKLGLVEKALTAARKAFPPQGDDIQRVPLLWYRQNRERLETLSTAEQVEWFVREFAHLGREQARQKFFSLKYREQARQADDSESEGRQ